MGTIANVRKHFDTKTPMNKCYILTREQLGTLSSKLSNNSFVNAMASGFEDKSKYIISVKSYPINLYSHYVTSPTNVVLGGQDTGIEADLILGGQNPNAYIDDAVINMGTFRLNEQFHSFLDYAPFTKAQLWLPYGNFIELDVNLIMNKTIAIKYVLSITTGNVTVFLLDVADSNNVILSTTLKIDFDVPFNIVNYNDMHKSLMGDALNFVGGAISTAVGVASSNPVATVGGVMKLASTTASAIVDTGNARVEKGGVVDSMGMLFAPQKPYIIVTRPTRKNPQYSKFKGFPSGSTRYLKYITGYTRVESVHLENFSNATQNEIDEIEQLLKSGVIL